MSCSIERLEELIKEVEDQRVQLANSINDLENKLLQAKNSYMKVLGAAEVLQIQFNEHAAKEAKVEAVPEASGD